MKKLMLLGGSRYLLPIINKAHDMGIYVITCDYLPNNVAHKYSDEYCNASVTKKDEILKVACDKKVDGIMSFACDPGVVTAAFVSEKLGLPTSPYESVCILQNKGKFRKFLADNGFNVPKARAYSEYHEAYKDFDYFDFPVIVKPTDSAGSKGVSKVCNIDELENAVRVALNNSASREFIIEEYIEQEGYSSDSDSFSVNGELKFCSFNNQCFDKSANNPYTPSGFMFPSLMPIDKQKELRSEIERLISLLHMGTCLYNIETRVGKDGKAYIMECSPRGGGNRLSELLEFASGQDLITNAIKASLGEKVSNSLGDPVFEKYWGEIVLHSNETGIFSALCINEDFRVRYVKEIDLWVKKGELIESFVGANKTIGTIIVSCPSMDELKNCINNVNEFVNIKLKESVQ